MCSTSRPKVQQTQPAPVEYLHNPFADMARNATGSALAARAGRSALRIRRGSGARVDASGRLTDPTAPSPASRPAPIKVPPRSAPPINTPVQMGGDPKKSRTRYDR